MFELPGWYELKGQDANAKKSAMADGRTFSLCAWRNRPSNKLLSPKDVFNRMVFRWRCAHCNTKCWGQAALQSLERVGAGCWITAVFWAFSSGDSNVAAVGVC